MCVIGGGNIVREQEFCHGGRHLHLREGCCCGLSFGKEQFVVGERLSLRGVR
jgi:hypothetical protein